MKVTLTPATLETLTDTLNTLVDNKIASRIANQDPTVWGEDAREEASKRMGWVTLPTSSRDLPTRIAELKEELGTIDRVILAGMGGSSLAPEVMSCAYGKNLLVCDSTHPDHVAALAQQLDTTVVIVASKSGSTVETDSARRYFAQRFTDAGIDPASRLIAVTDPGSPLDQRATEEGWRAIFHADPSVGGRYSALSAFGLVPAGLAGVDVAQVLADAAEVADSFALDSADNPVVQLAALVGYAHARGHEKLALDPRSPQLSVMGVWIEQLIAESTGKDGKGILPIAPQDTPGVTTVSLSDSTTSTDSDSTTSTDSGTDAFVTGPLGAQFLLWEYVTAAVSYLIGVNPFDQPNVESAKAAMRALLAGEAQESTGATESFVDGDITVSGPHDLVAGATTVAQVLDRLSQAVPAGGYVGIQAFVNRLAHANLVALRPKLAAQLGVATTFGFGPRYLHSTGQYHKGGHPNGGFVQITDTPAEDFAVPGTEFTFAQLIAAQAQGDADVLTGLGRPVVRLHVTDVGALSK